jgi:predicted kinase
VVEEEEGGEHVYVDYGQGVYDSMTTRRTYERFRALAVDEALSGKRVLIDATYTKAEQRQEIFRGLRLNTDDNLDSMRKALREFL